MAQKLQLRIYKAAVSVIGFITLALLTYWYPIHDGLSLCFFVALAIIAETQTVSLEHDRSVSICSAIIIASLLFLGPGAAVIVAAASVVGSVTKVNKKTYHIFNTHIDITLFNVGNYVITIAVNGVMYFLLGGRLINHANTIEGVISQINPNALQLVASILISILVNTLLVSIYISISSRSNIFRVWFQNLAWPIVSLFFVSILGILIVTIYLAYGMFIVLLLFAPFMLARYVFVTYNELRHSYLQTVKSLATAIETKDAYTSGHSRRVEEYSLLIARQMHLSPRRCETLRYAALLHDIGKIGIPEDILNKKGRLDESEWRQIQTHPVTGAHIIEDIEFLSGAVDIVKCHHEKVDGTGYPEGRDSAHMPLEAMILCAADAYDAMTSLRPYHLPMTHEEALKEMYDKAGSQFLPDVVRAFDLAMKKAAEQGVCIEPSEPPTDQLTARECAAAKQSAEGEKDK